jgi:hypothetical protein
MPTGVAGSRTRGLRALLVPAGGVPAEVIEVGGTAQAISDALGGHLLDDTTIGQLPGGRQVTFYRSEDPGALPDNPAAAALAARTVWSKPPSSPAADHMIDGSVVTKECRAHAATGPVSYPRANDRNRGMHVTHTQARPADPQPPGFEASPRASATAPDRGRERGGTRVVPASPQVGRTDGAGISPEPAVGPARHQKGEPMTQALGYLSLPSECAGDWREQVVNAAAGDFAAFAHRAGYRLAGVFTDVRGQSEHGFPALVTALRSHGAGAVVVPELSHLRQVGCLAGAGAATAARFLQADLLVVDPSSANDCGSPDVGAPGTDPVDGHPEPGRRDARGGVVGARR